MYDNKKYIFFWFTPCMDQMVMAPASANERIRKLLRVIELLYHNVYLGGHVTQQPCF